MAMKYVTTGGTLVIPSASAEVQVARQNSGLGTSGVVAVIGEAESGPAFDEELDLEDGALFGPDQVSSVVAKYGSGPVVDAFRAAAQPANDPNITGAPSRILVAKTNIGTKASLATLKVGGGSYGTLWTKLAGRNGNLLFSTISAVAEVVPGPKTFAWIPPVGIVTSELRLNGGAALAPTLGANITPTDAKTALNGLTGVGCTGAVNRGMIDAGLAAGAATIKVDFVSGKTCTFTCSSDWTVQPVVGDTLVVPLGSQVSIDTDGGGADVATPANIGAYIVIEVTSTKIVKATKKSDAAMVGAVAGTVSTPVTKIAVDIVAANDDLVCYSPLILTVDAADAIDGMGKSLEISELAGADLLSRCMYDTALFTPVTYISKTGAAVLVTSATESSVTINLTRQNDAISEELTAGGVIAMLLSYQGTTATVTITSSALTVTRAGGSGADLNLTLADYSTIADLVAFINAQTGYLAAVGTTTLGQMSPTTLDRVTSQGICSSWGAKNGRIKMDAHKLFTVISDQSSVVQLGDPATRAAAGLPAVIATTTFFANGAKGSSTNAQFTGAMDALALVEANFVVPCISRDSAADIADNLTDTNSSYDVDSVNAYARTHVLAMSKLKKRKNRQAFLSKKSTFSAAKDAAANIASPRCSMTFQDDKAIDSQGNIAQMQPWVGAAVAAGMQAAGFYKAIVRKFANLSGAVQAAGDFDDRDDTQVEDALLAGLLPLKRHPSGGWYWVSDQTTYSRDDNFLFNSIQAVYASDIVALTTARRMEDAFVGQSVADISASAALAFLEGIFADFRRLKLIAPSDDAPMGFKNAKITIAGSVMIVEAEIKLAGAIYFIPITFLVSPVSQTASQG